MSQGSARNRANDDPRSAAGHARYKELLDRHFDGDLRPAERDELFDHIGTCDQCREILEAEERLVDRLTRIPKLLPPSELRARIMREAAREREEMMHTLDSDERFSRIYAAPEDIDEDGEELAVFADSPQRTPARRRRKSAWRRYSPIAATLFLFAASTGALLTADFSSIPPLAQAQGMARSAFSQAGSAFASAFIPPAPSSGGPAPNVNTIRIQIAESRLPDVKEGIAKRHRSLGLDESILHTAKSISERITRLRKSVTLIADAARFTVPEPAEQARPVTAAIVLKPTDTATALTTDDDFGTVIRQTAENQPGGRIASEDQFVYDGHRYRCYTLEVSGEWFDHLVEVLGKYRSPSDSPVLRVLNEQGHSAPEVQNVAFFSAPGREIRNAVSSYHDYADRDSARPRQVKIYVVE